MSARMGLMIHSVLLLLTSGAVSDTEVVNGTLGNHIYFNQSISNPALLLQWYFNSIFIAARFPHYAPECISDYAERCQMYDNGTLRLNNLTSADDGIYRFIAQQPPATTVKEAFYELRVYSFLNAPVLTRNGTSNNLIGGTYVSLYCNAGGHGQTVTTYTFYRDGKNICSEPHVTCRDSYLYFQPITGSNSGSHTCAIQNPVSTNTSNTLYLNVSDPVSNVKLTSNILGLVWPGLDLVSLTCSANGTDVTYSWSLQGAPLPQDPRYYVNKNSTVLTVSPVSANDNGTFTCTASNWINHLISNGINLKLGSRVSAVTLTSNTSGSYIWAGEDSVSLHCSADGSDVTFFWRLSGKPLPPGSQYHISEGESPPHSNLLISPISKSDAGPFTCEASNRLDSKNSNAMNLSLAWNPERNIACSAMPDGQNIELGCSWSGGHPEAYVYLTFNGEIKSGMSNVTSLLSIGGNFQGSNLICHGDQLGRKSQCTMRIGPPETPGHDNNAITDTTVGGILNLTLTLEPGMPANFTWLHSPSSQSKESIQSRESLVSSTNFSSCYLIRDVTVDDAGQYVCIAENIIGTRSFLFTVSVTKNVPPTDGLSGGAMVVIAIGVVVGGSLIGIAVFFIVKKTKTFLYPAEKHSGRNKRVSEPEHHLETFETFENQMNVNVPEQHIYERTLPATQGNTSQESHYEQLSHKDKAIYSIIESTAGKY